MTSYTTSNGTTFTFPRANFVGFEHLFNEMNRSLTTTGGYPPHNVVQIDEDNYLIEIAVAGFKQENLDVELKDSILTVTGKKEDDRAYTHKGISSREFTRAFTLGEHVQVVGARLEDGILSIELERVIPENERPRKIEIGVEAKKPKKSFLKD